MHDTAQTDLAAPPQPASAPSCRMTVTTRITGNLGWVTIDNPPVNALSQAVRAGLMAALHDMTEAGVAAVVLTCAGRTFVAGADVAEFGQPPLPPHLPDVLLAIEQSPVPWIAAIHGTALGGGLELALACAYRIVDPAAKLGLPEVTLGLIPGAGGTVRLPRLVAPEIALEMIAGGKPITAQRSLDIGLADLISDGSLDAATEAFAAQVIGKALPVPVSQRAAVQPQIAGDWQAVLTQTKRRAFGQTAVIAAADAVVRSLTLSGAAALVAERAAFLTLKDGPQSAALRYMFFAERSAAKSAATGGALAAELTQVGVIGGGTMGAGIAAACLMAGLRTTMIERSDAAARTGADRVVAIVQDAETRGKLREPCAQVLARFEAVTDYAALAPADLVIEAVFEDMAVKREVFGRLDQVTRADAILASNTSYLDVATLAAQTQHPERVIGLHFFSPAHVMKLLEVIVPDSASGRAVATGLLLGKRLGKIAVPAGVCDGFIGNRIMSAYRREADYMIEDGALPQDVDAAMRDFGFPIGIFQMQDLAGLDISWAMRKRRAATRPASERYVAIADKLCEAARLGRKTGQGWYDYRTNPKGAIDPDVVALIEAESAAKGIARAPLTADAIMARLLTIMQTEGRAILAEGIAATPEAIDVVMVNGYGFPRWRGGPMFMAHTGRAVS